MERGEGLSRGVGAPMVWAGRGSKGGGAKISRFFFSRLAPSNLLFFVSHWVSSR